MMGNQVNEKSICVVVKTEQPNHKNCECDKLIFETEKDINEFEAVAKLRGCQKAVKKHNEINIKRNEDKCDFDLKLCGIVKELNCVIKISHDEIMSLKSTLNCAQKHQLEIDEKNQGLRQKI